MTIGRVALSLFASLLAGSGVSAQLPAPEEAPVAFCAVEATAEGEATAQGEFSVAMTPLESAAAGIDSVALTKSYSGDLVGKASGQMLAVRTPVDGSAGYVAMELVTGTLDGRQGSFALQHSGLLAAGSPALTISVVPDSGTGALTGLRGSLKIDIREGKHYYCLRYTLPEG
ncbi:DUF3224 domain-containing protein [Citromicrobium bathyomarinum]|uniref:DUF3224 domain-containing protein n=1 Tax=Citromicrobium bathyomarinum TaxID=72174 RepID=UPI00315ADD38